MASWCRTARADPARWCRRSNMRAWLTFIFALLVVESYRLAGSVAGEREWWYVSQGFGMCFLSVFAALRVPSGIAAASLWWLAAEQAQVALCGIGSYGIEVQPGNGLCTTLYGSWWYSPIAAVAIYLTVRLYGSEHSDGRGSGDGPDGRRPERQ